MAGFADDLGTALTGTLARTTAPPPPPPKGSFSDGLAAFFGGGPDIAGAYDAGLEDRSKYNVQSAQTLNALSEAEKRRQEMLRESTRNDIINKARANPGYTPGVSDLLAFSTSANDMSSGQLNQQELGFRGTLGDPGAAPAAQHAAGQGVKGEMLPHLYDVGGETVNQTVDPNATFRTPAQEQDMQAVAALEGQRERSPAAGAAGKPPSGYRYTEAGDLEFVPGGPADPARKAAGATIALPAKVRQSVAENDGLLSNIDRTIAIVEQYPDSFGLKYALGDIVNQRIDEAGVPARAAVADISSAKLHDRSGAAIAAKEFPRLTPFIPAITDKAETVIAKLRAMREAIEAEQEAIRAGYQAPGAAPGAAPAGGAAAPLRKTSKSGKPIVSNDGGKTWEYE